MTVRRWTGRVENLEIDFDGQQLNDNWASFQVLVDRWLIRLYSKPDFFSDNNPQLERNQEGVLTVTKDGIEQITIQAKVNTIATPYTWDDCIVYEFQGKVF